MLVPGKALSPNGFTATRHKSRLEKEATLPDIKNDPELARAWHSLQLHWLSTVPGYREEIRQRVSAAAKVADTKARKMEKNYKPVDLLGRDIDGCG
jgi:hypothetical protein